MAEHYNLVGPHVVQQPDEILPMRVRHQYPLCRRSCSETKPHGFNSIQQFGAGTPVSSTEKCYWQSQFPNHNRGSKTRSREERCSRGLGASWDELSCSAMENVCPDRDRIGGGWRCGRRRPQQAEQRQRWLVCGRQVSGVPVAVAAIRRGLFGWISFSANHQKLVCLCGAQNQNKATDFQKTRNSEFCEKTLNTGYTHTLNGVQYSY
jgi:hypothetical protein